MGHDSSRRVLMVGAFDRDNFGDILFALLTRERLQARGHQVALSSLVFSDMRGVFGEFVYPYAALLQTFTWDAVWVVGGEVGSAETGDAMRLTLEPSTSQVYAATDPSSIKAKQLLHGIGAPEGGGLGYVPDLRNYTLNAGTTLIMNSVGGFRVNGRAEFLANHAGPTFISLRDKTSYDALANHGFTVRRFAPDLVHSIALVYPFKRVDKHYLLFQISEAVAADHDVQEVGRSLALISARYEMPVYLFPAGLAPGHDSRDVYLDLQRSAQEHVSPDRIRVIEDRHPVKLARWIAEATAWIGSSLHGRIIASAYAVPRVSLDKAKLNAYAQQWDPVMPHSVSVRTIEDALGKALANQSEDHDLGTELRKGADENFRKLAAHLEGVERRALSPRPGEVDYALETLVFLRRRSESAFRRDLFNA